MAYGFGATANGGLGTGATDRVESSATLSGLTTASWVASYYCTGAGGGGAGVLLGRHSGSTRREVIYYRDSTNLNFLRQYATTSGLWSIDGFALNTNQRIVVTFSSTTPTVRAWINGVERTVTQQTAPVGSISNNAAIVSIGNNGTGSYNAAWWGWIEEVAGYSVELSPSEAMSLSAGLSPMLIQPNNLRWYLPLNSVIDYRGATYTATGALNISRDTPVILQPQALMYPPKGTASNPLQKKFARSRMLLC